MGMTINKAMEILTAENFNGYSMSEIIEARNMTLDIMRKYQQFQADYETRLKADLKAILVELQLEIEEKFNDRPFSYNHHQRTEFYRDIDEVIQQKINSLKEKKND